MAMVDAAEVTLPSDGKVKVTRRFKAPRALVYRAYTEPALLQRWMLGPDGWSMPVCDMDVRPGGSYRWRWREDASGVEFGFFGEFREVEPGIRITHTQLFDPGTTGAPRGGDDPAIVDLAFADDGRGGTLVTTVVDFGSREARDAVLATGMTTGMERGYQRLDDLFASGALG